MQGGEGNAAAGIATSEVIDVHEVVPGRPDTRDLVIDLREQSSVDEAVETTEPESGDESSAATPPTGELHGRVAVVTGGASGVGREVALRLARAGARVCVLGRDLALLRDTVELAGPEAAILYLQCDVGSVSEIEGVVDFIDRFDRPVDLLVHAEGVHVRGGIEPVHLGRLQQVMRAGRRLLRERPGTLQAFHAQLQQQAFNLSSELAQKDRAARGQVAVASADQVARVTAAMVNNLHTSVGVQGSEKL